MEKQTLIRKHVKFQVYSFEASMSLKVDRVFIYTLYIILYQVLVLVELSSTYSHDVSLPFFVLYIYIFLVIFVYTTGE